MPDELLESGMLRAEKKVKSFAGEDALLNEVQHFVTHVRNRTRPDVSGVEGKRALEVVMQVMDQIKEHQNLDLYRRMRPAADR